MSNMETKMTKPRWQHIDYHIYDPNAPGERNIISIEPDIVDAVNDFLYKYPGSTFKVIEHGYRHILPITIQMNLEETNK